MSYFNPVEIIETNNWQQECKASQKKLGIQKPLVISSELSIKRHNFLSLFKSKSIFTDIKINPTIKSCQLAINFNHSLDFDGVISIGGGSVMDTSKIVMASMATGIKNVSKLIEFSDPFKKKIPSIFIPTTHGTGSEVTKWGTIWDQTKKKKYSIDHEDLYPSVAILDGSLTLSLPISTSIVTILDALSHSFEAIWNKNANETSTEYAINAICLILDNVERLKHEPENLIIRNVLIKASNMAGLAFSNTKTAAAHSISYPLTLYYGIPHGIASSISLLPLLKINRTKIKDELNKILNHLQLNDFMDLEKQINKIFNDTISYRLQDWGVHLSDLDFLIDKSFTKERMENNIVDLNKEDVCKILKDIY